MCFRDFDRLKIGFTGNRQKVEGECLAEQNLGEKRRVKGVFWF